jgi:glycosyltransferase involved in cell wall biosynthesis
MPETESSPTVSLSLRTLQIGDDWIGDQEGGLARYYYELIRHLPGTGTSAKGLVVGTEKAALATGGQIVAFSDVNSPMLKRLRLGRKAAIREINAKHIDLVASHFALYTIPIADRLRSFPNVTHFHGPWAAESVMERSTGLRSRLKATLEKTVYRRADRLIVLSKSFESELVKNYGVVEERIRVVPGGVDCERFNLAGSRADARRSLNWPLDRPIVLSVRRQVRRMGLESLIDAATRIVKVHPTVLILLGGSGPITGELAARIQELGLTDSVRQLGRVPDSDLPTAYRAADMTVVPSTGLEGFGLITLESLAAGTPVFVTPVGGLADAVTPFAPQCVFAGTGSEVIASTLCDALGGAIPMPTEEECRRHAEKYSWGVIAAKVRNIYDEALV